MGILYAVGIGPGSYDDMTVRADRALKEADLIVGYHVYVDLIRDRFPEKTFRTTAMTQEAERCRIAVEAARSGQTVAVVCSGDSGIYGMAALLYEIRGDCEDPEIRVIPGITAAVSGAALAGAPLTHDFAVISLSDRLTPWETIRARLEAAARADLTIVLYNPASRGRPHHLREACGILLEILPGDRIVSIAQRIGREGETVRMMTLEELKDAEADMYCTIFIGNRMTKIITGKMVTPRGYPV